MGCLYVIDLSRAAARVSRYVREKTFVCMCAEQRLRPFYELTCLTSVYLYAYASECMRVRVLACVCRGVMMRARKNI